MPFDLHHNFSLLNIEDQELIQKYTNRFEPYSDFNFTSLLSWNTDQTVEFAIYQDCMIIKLPDYVTQITCYSILGQPAQAQRVISELISLLDADQAKFEFALIPEISITDFKTPFSLVDDPDQHDYIYSTAAHTQLEGHRYAWQRRRLSFFSRACESKSVEIRTMLPDEISSIFLPAWSTWQKASETIPDSRYQYEKIAIQRYAEYAHELRDQIILGLFIDDVIHGITMAEPSGKNQEYATCHFMKVNYQYPGIFNKMFHELAKYTLKEGQEFINFEQDLGLPGLKTFKQFLKPDAFLKKYRLSVNAQPEEPTPE